MRLACVRVRFSVIAIAALAAAGSGRAAASVQAPAPAPAAPAFCQIAGSWVLNGELSREPGRLAETDASVRRDLPRPWGARSRRSGRAGYLGAPAQGLSGRDRDRLRRLQRIVAAELAAAPRLAVACDAAGLMVSAGDDRPETLIVDGRKHLRLTGDGEINTTTTWHEGRLVSERRYDEGIKATRTYAIEIDGAGVRRLVVVLKVDGFRGPGLGGPGAGGAGMGGQGMGRGSGGGRSGGRPDAPDDERGPGEPRRRVYELDAAPR